MANIVGSIFSTFRFIFMHPVYAVLFTVMILLMPLEVLDLLLYIIVNLLVVILNVVYWLLVLFVNFFITAINLGLEALFDALSSLLGSNAPQLDLFVYQTQPYVEVNLFSPTSNLLLIILGLFT